MVLWVLGIVAMVAVLLAASVRLLIRRLRAPGGKTGSIEGVLLIDGKPAPPGTPVACHLSRESPSLPRVLSFVTGESRSEFCHSAVLWSEYTMTEDEGEFVFKRVPVGEVGLGRAYGQAFRKTWLFGWAALSDDRNVNSDHERNIAVQANETSRVTLGIPATRVRGRFVDPMDSKGALQGLSAESAFLSSNFDEPPIPDEIPSEERDAWWKDFLKSEAGRGWQERIGRMYQIFVDSQGGFEIPNVRPGRYKFQAQLNHTANAIDRYSRPFGEFNGIIDVPGDPESPVAATLDLGELPLQIFARLEPGDSLPDVTVRNQNGEPLALAPDASRYLLLCLWWPHDDIWGSIPKTLNAIDTQRDSYGDLDTLAVVMDGQGAPAQYRLHSKTPSWQLKVVLEDDSLSLATAFGIRESAFFLFAPGGKLIEGEIKTSGLDAALRRVFNCVA